MSSSSVLSQTLRSLTVTKIKELEKLRASYNSSKAKILATADSQDDARQRLSVLVDGLKKFPELKWYQRSSDIDAAQRCLVQSGYDPTVRSEKLSKEERNLRARLDAGSQKLDLVHLYSRLLTEWIEKPGAEIVEPEAVESGSDESFEVLQDTQKQRLEQLRDKFARVVFEPFVTDEAEIDDYLRRLFESDRGKKRLKIMRDEVSRIGTMMLSENFRLDDQSLKWCVKALLKNDMLNDEKKATLREFLKDEAVMAEIRDVLNMRIRDIKTWDWDLGEEGMPVMPRQSLNGKWRVMMDDDVLQALLTHWIGTYWAVQCKNILLKLQRWTSAEEGSHLPEQAQEKLSYFLGDTQFKTRIHEKNVHQVRAETYQRDFLLAPLPSKLFEEAGGYDDDDDDPPETDPDKKSPKDIKQLLLRTLATEVILRRSLDGQVAVVQSDFQWFAAGMPHSTIFAVLRFMGFQEDWLSFFRKALSPPMDMLDGRGPRRRQRGLPMAHIFEKLLGELVLFFMDLAVAQESNMLLYRFHDDLWLAGNPSRCAAAWRTMETFAKVMGLEFNMNKTGSVYLTSGDLRREPAIEKALPAGPVEMNFLNLNAQTGEWTINQEHVELHVKQLQRQLNESESVLQWIKTWNSCIGRFFSYTFGEPAGCFGPDHLESILTTHRKLQEFLFHGDTGSTVIEHLKGMVERQFQYADSPDSFFSMPESLGGLGLKNPFTSLLLLRESLKDNTPEKVMADFFSRERALYQQHKETFEAQSEKERRKQYKAAFIDDDDDDKTAIPTLTWEQAQTFFSFEEYTAHRELTSSELHSVYKQLMSPARQKHIEPNDEVKNALRYLDGPEGLDLSRAEDVNLEALWTVLYFQDELFDKFGGVEIVDRTLLPLGVLKAVKEKKVTWQMVL